MDKIRNWQCFSSLPLTMSHSDQASLQGWTNVDCNTLQNCKQATLYNCNTSAITLCASLSAALRKRNFEKHCRRKHYITLGWVISSVIMCWKALCVETVQYDQHVFTACIQKSKTFNTSIRYFTGLQPSFNHKGKCISVISILNYHSICNVWICKQGMQRIAKSFPWAQFWAFTVK